MNLSKSDSSPFHNPQARVAKILWGTVGACVGVSLVVYLAGGSSPAWRVPLALGMLIQMAALYCQFVIVPNSDRFLDVFRRDDYLARWTYSDDQWRQWEQASPRTSKDPTARDAYITSDAVYFEGFFNCWSLTSNHMLEYVSIEASPMPVVCLVYSGALGNFGESSLRTVQIPIPGGMSRRGAATR